MTQYHLTEEQQMLRDSVSRIAREKLANIAEENDEKSDVPWKAIEICRENQLFGLPFPEIYGGAGGGIFGLVIALEQLARVCAVTSLAVATQALAAMPILIAGNEEQKKKYLPKLSSAEWIGAFSMTEPGAGSDAGALSTRAVLDGDDYIINGRKCFNTHADVADILTVLAKTASNAGVKGISAFIFASKNARGFSTPRKEKKMGFNGSTTCEVLYEDCKVPKSNLLGEENKGFSIAMRTLDKTRPAVAAVGLGLSQGALEDAIRYSKERVQFGKPISSFQGIQWMLADMAMKVEAARQVTYKAAALADQDSPEAGLLGAMAKCIATDCGMSVSADAVQIFGGYGYMKDYPVERRMRQAKLLQIVEGTNQIQRVVISGHILK